MGLREIFLCIGIVVGLGIDTWLLIRNFRQEIKKLEEPSKKQAKFERGE